MIDATQTNTATLFLAFNEDGNVAADTDRDVAIERLSDDHGGYHVRVIELKVAFPVQADLQASFTVPADRAETVEVTTA